MFTRSMHRSFKDSLKALEADIQHANTLSCMSLVWSEFGLDKMINKIQEDLKACKEELRESKEAVRMMLKENSLLAQKIQRLERKDNEEKSIMENNFEEERTTFRVRIMELEKKLESVGQALCVAESTLTMRNAQFDEMQNNLKELEELREMKELLEELNAKQKQEKEKQEEMEGLQDSLQAERQNLSEIMSDLDRLKTLYDEKDSSLQMAVAAVAHVYIFSPEPYCCLPASEHGKTTTFETKTKVKMEDLEEGPAVVEETETRVKAPGTSFTECVQDVVLGGGEHGEMLGTLEGCGGQIVAWSVGNIRTQVWNYTIQWHGLHIGRC